MKMPRDAAGPLLIALFVLSGYVAPAEAQSIADPGRGELLYSTHCIACHNTRVHWRDQKIATDWDGLRTQVRRWQAVQELGWSEADISEVARHLNTHYYHYPVPE